MKKLSWLGLILILSLSTRVVINASEAVQDSPDTFKNPILSGYHPDPSICRVGDDYYLVNSTFCWFPGIPIYHSKDLVNWKLIGHGINRADQLEYDGLIDKFGIFAVTIRHHDGVFYLITTMVGNGGNFYITATDPAGPWSDPVWLKDAPGIDPSLMWDSDGKCYYSGQMRNEPQKYSGDCVVWSQELDLQQQKLVGERWIHVTGHAVNAIWSEGPHIYNIDGNYLLMHSEGGTDINHALTVHHADTISGPYVTDPVNPVLTHRHFGRGEPVQAIGHGDLVLTQNGEWWCVTLGKRVHQGYTTLARETFLSKVHFEGKTPIFNDGVGRVLNEQIRPDLPWTPVEKGPVRDAFEGDKLALKWCTIRNPKSDYYQLMDGGLKLKLLPQKASELHHFSTLIQRVEHYEFEAKTKLSFSTKEATEHAGLILYRTQDNHYLLMKEKDSIVLIKSFKGEVEEIARVPYSKKDVCFAMTGHYLEAKFFFGESEDSMTQIGGSQTLVVIADGNGNQFNGAGVGMYGSSNGNASSNSANFHWFEYRSN